LFRTLPAGDDGIRPAVLVPARASRTASGPLDDKGHSREGGETPGATQSSCTSGRLGTGAGLY
jgi:hypothetical protein